MDTFLTIGMITRESSRVLKNNTIFTSRVNRDYDDYFSKKGAMIGNVVNVRKPVRSVYTSGQGLILQDLKETSIPVTLTTQYQRSFAVTSQDLALNINDFSRLFIDKHVVSLANQVDDDGLAQYINVNSEVGTPGTVPTSTDTYLQAQEVLDNAAAPRDDRNIIMSPAMNRKIVGALTGLLNPQRQISSQYSKGMMAKDTLGFDWFMDQNVGTQKVGPLGGTPTVNATAGQTGSAIVTTGWTAAAAKRLNKGDVIQFAGVNAVNPQNRRSTGRLADFVLTADFSSDGSGNGTINISPAIITAGTGVLPDPFQNVDAAPAALAAITVNGAANTSSPRGLAYHPDAFIFATADLPKFGGLDRCDRVTDDDLKISIRCIRDYDINMDRAPLRLDFLGGWQTFYPELAVRIAT